MLEVLIYLNIVCFMVEVRVYSTLHDFAEHHTALVKRIEYESVQVPYDHIVETFRCLFGSQCVVNFVVTP